MDRKAKAAFESPSSSSTRWVEKRPGEEGQARRRRPLEQREDLCQREKLFEGAARKHPHFHLILKKKEPKREQA